MTTTSASPVRVDSAESPTRSSGGTRVGQKRRSPSDGTDSGGGSRETWISTNKILNSSLCGRRMNSRNPNFDYDETKLLISLWGDPQVQKTLITTHKKHPVIAELARKMREQGYNRSTEEINTRIKNLKCFYNRIKKDMAAGIINQTTWRHYGEMDEIISRPVFGNAHRLHLLQQQKQHGQSGALHQYQQQGGTGSERIKDMYDDDDLSLDQLHQTPVKLEVMSDDDDDEAAEIRAEDLLTIDAKFPEESILGGNGGGGCVGPSGGLGKTVGGSVVARKAENGRGVVTNGRSGKQTDEDDDEEEDDDDDEEDDDEGSDFDVENEFNDGLDELLQKAQAKGAAGSGSVPAKPTFGSSTATTSKGGNASGLVIETISSANGGTITATSPNSAPSTVGNAGKISVVPTNLLLKQPTVSSGMTTPIQIYTQPTVTLASSTMRSSVTVTKVPGTMGLGGTLSGGVATGVVGTPGSSGVTPMKLLLVNTVAKDGTTKQILTPASEVPSMSHLLPRTTSYHQSNMPLALPTKAPIVSIPTLNVAQKAAGDASKSATITTVATIPSSTAGIRKSSQQSAGFKTLLTQLVTIQRENLAINREQLALEKERLEFEKQFGGSFITMVRNMSTFFCSMLQHQRRDQKPDDREEVELPTVKKQMDLYAQKEEVQPELPAAGNDAPPPSAVEVRDISSSPSPTPSASGIRTATSATKRLSSDTAIDPPSNRSSPKDLESSLPVLTPSPSMKQNAGLSPASSEHPIPNKRRMMTRNSLQLSQVPPPAMIATDESLKMEVISDTDER